MVLPVTAASPCPTKAKRKRKGTKVRTSAEEEQADGTGCHSASSPSSSAFSSALENQPVGNWTHGNDGDLDVTVQERPRWELGPGEGAAGLPGTPNSIDNNKCFVMAPGQTCKSDRCQRAQTQTPGRPLVFSGKADLWEEANSSTAT